MSDQAISQRASDANSTNGECQSGSLHDKRITSSEGRAQCLMQLRKDLDVLRKRNERIRRVSESTDEAIEKLAHRVDALDVQRLEAIQRYKTAIQERSRLENNRATTQQWNVFNDCFQIWYEGAFGVINGLRLGAEAPSLAVPPKEGHHAENGTNNENGTTSQTLRSYLIFPRISRSDIPQPLPAPEPQVILVPWSEINAALGHTVLLLHVLQERSHSMIKFIHTLIPMGSTSKIGVRQKASDAPVVYNLFSDDGFSLFGKRNFNIALNSLAFCVVQAGKSMFERDRTIVMPYPFEPTTNRFEWLVGGLPISLGVDRVAWTTAMKYLLVNIKWIVAYAAKHADI